MLTDRQCESRAETYRDLVAAYIDCRAANAGHQADKQAIREFYDRLN